MKQYSVVRLLTRILAYSAILIFVLVPFHAFLTVWLHSLVGHYTLLRLWTVLLLIVLSAVALLLLRRDKLLRRQIIKNKLVWLIVAYGLLTIVFGAVALYMHQVNRTALGYALVSNLRFIVFFLICLIIGVKTALIRKNWITILLLPAVIVVVFGLLQRFVLPVGFLYHFGYGPQTINAFQTVDQNIHFIRIQSTLRGSNPLGAYLVIIISALAILLIRAKNRYRSLLALLMSACLIVLFYTYSRSAWIAAVLTVGLVIYLLIHRKLRIVATGLGVLFVLIGIGALLSLRNNVAFENTFFHTSKLSRSRYSSNFNHKSAEVSGLKDIVREPLGRGPGSAGPASVYNNHPPRLAENYYLQIGQEVGILGLGLFMAINMYVVIALWKNRNDTLSLTLLASFFGITLINLFSHAWGDDTLAFIWWGMAGIAVAPGILKAKASLQHETQKISQKTTTI